MIARVNRTVIATSSDWAADSPVLYTTLPAKTFRVKGLYAISEPNRRKRLGSSSDATIQIAALIPALPVAVPNVMWAHT